jgi:hypothetical protein
MTTFFGCRSTINLQNDRSSGWKSSSIMAVLLARAGGVGPGQEKS